MRKLTDGQDQVSVEGSTMQQVVDNLETAFPGIKDRVCDGDRIRPGLAVVIDEEVARLGLLQRVKEDSEIHFVPAVSGGAKGRGLNRTR